MAAQEPAITPRTLKGFRDILPGEMIPRQRMMAALEEVFRRYGFLPLMTPALEYAQILTGKYGDEGDSLLYRFLDNGERDVALRYDLTVPLARVVAQYPELPRPFRRFQIAPVWRAEKPARGRFREFFQCDGDIVGSPDVIADAEIIQMGTDMLRALGVEKFTVRINNRKILSGLMSEIGVEPGPAEMGILRTIDKLPKIGEEKTRGLLASENALEASAIDRIFEFLSIEGSPREIQARLEGFYPADGVGALGVKELGEVLDFLETVGLLERVAVDLSIARGLNYYTGTIYETFLDDLPGFGAVMSGGRYDGLIGTFSREEIPGVGISLGIDRLLAGLGELGLLSEETTTASVLVTIFDPDLVAPAARAASKIREAGVACELYPQAARLKKQLKYAERTGKSFAIIIGSDEAEKGVVQVKHLAERSQEEVSLEEIGPWLAGRLADAGH